MPKLHETEADLDVSDASLIDSLRPGEGKHLTREAILLFHASRPLRAGHIDPDNFKPDPKNPLIAAFFANIASADTLGSSVRNQYKYTRIYSGLMS